MSMGRGGIFGNPILMPWEDDMERQRQRMEAEMGGQPQQPMQGGLLGSQQPQGKPPGFWQGGDKFRGKDAIAGLLAAIGDGLAQANGGQGWATQNLMGGRLDAREMAKKKAEEQAKLQQMMAVGGQLGMTPAQVQAQALGLDVSKPDIPPMVRDVQAWQGMTPDQRAAAQEMYSVRSPWRVTGQDGVPYQMNSGPRPGTVEDGYRFMGGDPGDPNNWEQVGGGTGNGAGGF